MEFLSLQSLAKDHVAGDCESSPTRVTPALSLWPWHRETVQAGPPVRTARSAGGDPDGSITTSTLLTENKKHSLSWE